MLSLILLLVLVGIAAYFRSPAWLISLAAVVGLALGGASWWAYIPVLVIAAACCLPPARDFILGRIFGIYKKITPAMSETEADAINAGTVWWDGELFSGKPDFSKLKAFPTPSLSAEEQAFIDGPVEELCKMLDDWKMLHETKDLPPEAWQFIKDSGILGMIIMASVWLSFSLGNRKVRMGRRAFAA